jgi:hypothetical protein
MVRTAAQKFITIDTDNSVINCYVGNARGAGLSEDAVKILMTDAEAFAGALTSLTGTVYSAAWHARKLVEEAKPEAQPVRQTWDLNALTASQLDFLANEITQTNDGAISVEPSNPAHVEAARALHALGIITFDESDDEYSAALTDDGEAWLLSLPEGALGVVTAMRGDK